jgi:hypothetical protein
MPVKEHCTAIHRVAEQSLSLSRNSVFVVFDKSVSLGKPCLPLMITEFFSPSCDDFLLAGDPAHEGRRGGIRRFWRDGPSRRHVSKYSRYYDISKAESLPK